MERRHFLHNIAHISAAPTLFSSLAFGNEKFNLNSPLANTITPGNILVLIKLNGGNDGLNTLIPLNMSSQLNKVRPHVVLPDNSIINLGKNDLGLHPALSGFKSFFEEDRLKIIQNVGYPIPNYSHFRSMDIWQSASDANKFVNSGWLGRYIEKKHPEFPNSYPNSNYPHPLSLEIGWNSSLLFTGEKSFTSVVASNPNDFYKIVNDFDNIYPSSNSGEKLKYLQLIGKQANQYGQVLKDYYQTGEVAVEFPRTNLGRQLEIVSKLISSGLKTRIYMVEIGGFDTHDLQVEEGDHSKGTHNYLLKELNDSITAFIKNLDSIGRSDDVLTMTFSEFGRTVHSNGTFGTDHGTVAPLFLFGNKIDPSISGENPFIPNDVNQGSNADQYEMNREYDFRQIYSSVISQWFNENSLINENVLLNKFKEIPLIKGMYKDPDLDTDNDGVADINDNCPDTPEGSIVDLTGCVIFSLPASNYTLKTVSNTCIGSNNGILYVSAENKEYDYNLEIPELEATYTLDSSNEHSLEISDLSIGLYTLKFTISDKEGYLQMFESQIGEPLPLEANANIDVASKTASLVLGGSEKYYVEINGEKKVVTDKYYYLPLKAGMNTIKVSTPLECQGVYEKEVFISEEVTYYPNPVNDVLNIRVPGSDRKVIVQVFNDSGASVIREELSIGFTRTVQLRTNRLTSGVYIVNVTGKTVLEKFKVIKK